MASDTSISMDSSNNNNTETIISNSNNEIKNIQNSDPDPDEIISNFLNIEEKGEISEDQEFFSQRQLIKLPVLCGIILILFTEMLR